MRIYIQWEKSKKKQKSLSHKFRASLSKLFFSPTRPETERIATSTTIMWSWIGRAWTVYESVNESVGRMVSVGRAVLIICFTFRWRTESTHTHVHTQTEFVGWCSFSRNMYTQLFWCGVHVGVLVDCAWKFTSVCVCIKIAHIFFAGVDVCACVCVWAFRSWCVFVCVQCQ